MKKKPPQDLEHIRNLLTGFSPWAMKERRGRKKKYFFYDMEKGQVIKKNVPINKSRAIQSSMKATANRDGVSVSIHNYGTYLLIKRTK